MDNFKKALLSVIIFTVFCGFIYTMVMTGICQVLFPNSANGKIIEVNGVKYGSELLGQQYTSDRYMWGRITKIDVSTYKDTEGNQLAYAAPSNLSPASEDYEKLIAFIEATISCILLLLSEIASPRFPTLLLICFADCEFLSTCSATPSTVAVSSSTTDA